MRKIQIDVFRDGDKWTAQFKPYPEHEGETFRLDNISERHCCVTLELKEDHHHDCTTELELKNAEFEARYADSPKDL